MANKQPHLNGQMGTSQIEFLQTVRTRSSVLAAVSLIAAGLMAITIGTTGFFFAVFLIIGLVSATAFFLSAAMLSLEG